MARFNTRPKKMVPTNIDITSLAEGDLLMFDSSVRRFINTLKLTGAYIFDTINTTGIVTVGTAGSGALLILSAQDGVNEGGQINFNGAGAFTDVVSLDRAENNMRLFSTSTATHTLQIFNAGTGLFNMTLTGSLAVTGSLTVTGGNIIAGTIDADFDNVTATSYNLIPDGDNLIQKTGTPVASQLAFWSNFNTVQGDQFLTFDGTTDTLTIGGDGVLSIEQTPFVDRPANLGNTGKFWVQNTDPTLPMFTDDVSGDQVIDPSISTINNQSGNYTLILSDKGKTVSQLATGTFTIPANASVAFPIGTMIGFQNSGGVLTIAITGDSLFSSLDGSTGTRTIAGLGAANIIKITSIAWKISGDQMT